MIAYVYQIFNTRNGKRYVGWTKDPTSRWSKHQRNALLGQKFYIYRALRKEFENFEFQVISVHSSENEAKKSEQFWVSFFNSSDERFGYNMTQGGEGCVMKGSQNPMFGRRGKLHHNFGKPWTQTQREASILRLKRKSDKFENIIQERKAFILSRFPDGNERGAVSALSIEWKISHTQVRRFINKHMETWAMGGRFPV